MVGATPAATLRLKYTVSIPERGLGWLERPTRNKGSNCPKFQSLRGVWGGWSDVLSTELDALEEFQSLRGVWGGWSGGLLKALGYVIFQVQTRGSC